MITKPPFELAASGGSDHDVEDMSDQIVVDSSQDVTVEASEESTLEIEDAPAGTETPPPTPAPLMASSMVTPPPMTSTAEVAHRGAPTLLGMPLPSLPLPGATSPSSLSLTPGPSSKDEDATLKVAEDDDDEEVTVMARPSVTDDEEEATKVEPAETAIRAASIKDEDDELTAALSTQATLERERALRKSLPPSLDVPLSAHSYGSSSDDFEDPDDDEVLATSTPGIVSVEDDLESATGNYSRGTDPDADQEEPSSELEAVLAPRRPTPGIGGSPLSGSLGGSPFAGSPFSASIPLARADGFGAARLPTPTSGIGLTLPSQPPAPSSPFSARTAPAGAPYPRTMSPAPTGPQPALQIPAPSGAIPMASGRGGAMRPVQLPVLGLALFGLAFMAVGVVIGGRFLGNRGPAAPIVAAAPVAAPPAIVTPPPAPAPSVAPAPPAPVAAATQPPATAPTPPPAAAAAPPAPPEPAMGGTGPSPETHPLVKRAARPPVHKFATASPTSPAPKPARAKVAKGWVDPFAE